MDEFASEIFISERFAQPVELLDGPVPLHRVVETSLVAEMLLHQYPPILRVNGDAGAEILRL